MAIDDHNDALAQQAQVYTENVLSLRFPDDKKAIGALGHEDKLAWYAHQFEIDQRAAVIMASAPEFARFWKWRVLMPMKFKRFYFRVKNGEIFKKYDHITEMRKKVKPHSI